MAHQPFALVAGAGPGLGQALMRRFIANGMTVVGLSRSGATDSDLDIRACDLTDANAVRSVIAGLTSAYGTPKIVVHNPAHLVIRPFLELTESDFIDSWRAMTLSAVLLGQSTLQPMVRGGGGSFLVSGATASLRGGANFAAFTAAKFALRGLTQSFAREFQPAGIHVAHIILDGIVDTAQSRALHKMDPLKMMSPDDIAETFWQIANQPQSVWSHEIDLRPQSEAF